MNLTNYWFITFITVTLSSQHHNHTSLRLHKVHEIELEIKMEKETYRIVNERMFFDLFNVAIVIQLMLQEFHEDNSRSRLNERFISN